MSTVDYTLGVSLPAGDARGPPLENLSRAIRGSGHSSGDYGPAEGRNQRVTETSSERKIGSERDDVRQGFEEEVWVIV